MKTLSETEFNSYIEKYRLEYTFNKLSVNNFFSNDTNFKRYIVGKNQEALNISKIVNIDGIVDDFGNIESWNGIKIVTSNDILNNSIILNCSTSISPVQVFNKFNNLPNSSLIQLSDILYENSNKIIVPSFILEMIHQWEYNKIEWFNLYKSLNDETSRKTLLRLILFRLTADIKYMKNFNIRLKEQYFEEFMNYNSEIFVDIGGFDGDTTELFCNRFPNYEKVLFFEPSSINMISAKKRLANFKNIFFYQIGLSNKNEELYFDEKLGSSSTIVDSGENKISTSTLDHQINEPITFLKMDIEGWELKALEGCKNHIINDTPKLAITVYHNASDFIEIPKYILGLNSNYDIYLRHYTSGWSETVMYFVPRNIN